MKKVALWSLALVLFPAIAGADFDVTIHGRSPDLRQGVHKVLIVSADCHESLDCSLVEQRVYEDLTNLRVGWTVVAPGKVRETLFGLGQTTYAPNLLPTLLEKFPEIDAVLEIRIPFANRGDGFGGRRRSEVKVEILVKRPAGEILLAATGTGRPLNVVSGSERVAVTTIEKIFRKALGGP